MDLQTMREVSKVELEDTYPTFTTDIYLIELWPSDEGYVTLFDWNSCVSDNGDTIDVTKPFSLQFCSNTFECYLEKDMESVKQTLLALDSDLVDGGSSVKLEWGEEDGKLVVYWEKELFKQCVYHKKNFVENYLKVDLSEESDIDSEIIPEQFLEQYLELFRAKGFEIVEGRIA